MERYYQYPGYTDHLIQEACIRVRSGTRGGIWVLGRIIHGRVLIIVVEKCDTMNEMNDVLQQVIEVTLGHIIV